jgi:hypothetical protein
VLHLAPCHESVLGSGGIAPLTLYLGTTRVYPKLAGLAACSEKCKWYSSLPLCAVVSLFVSQYSEFCATTLSVASQCVFIIVILVYFIIDSGRKLLDTPSHMEVSGQLHTPAAPRRKKSPLHPLDRRRGGPQSRSQRGDENRNLYPVFQSVG